MANLEREHSSEKMDRYIHCCSGIKMYCYCWFLLTLKQNHNQGIYWLILAGSTLNYAVTKKKMVFKLSCLSSHVIGVVSAKDICVRDFLILQFPFLTIIEWMQIEKKILNKLILIQA